jgi:calcium-dependent protein kinase
VAIKTLYRSMIDETDFDSMFSEYEMLKTLDHPNIMRTFNLIYDAKKLNIVTEIFKGGDMFSKLEI